MNTDELRAIAEAATPGPWEYDPDDMTFRRSDGQALCECDPWSYTLDRPEDFAHIATFSPDRILAMLDVIEAADDPAVYDVMSDTTMYPAHKRLAAALARLREVK